MSSDFRKELLRIGGSSFTAYWPLAEDDPTNNVAGPVGLTKYGDPKLGSTPLVREGTKSVLFDGNDDSYSATEKGPAAHTYQTGQFTFGAWIKTTGDKTDEQCILAQTNRTSDQAGIAFAVRNGTDLQLVMGDGTSGGTTLNINKPDTITPGQTHFVWAIGYGSDVRIGVDTAVSAAVSIPWTPSTSLGDPDRTLDIGSLDRANFRQLDGRVSDVFISTENFGISNCRTLYRKGVQYRQPQSKIEERMQQEFGGDMLWYVPGDGTAENVITGEDPVVGADDVAYRGGVLGTTALDSGEMGPLIGWDIPLTNVEGGNTISVWIDGDQGALADESGGQDLMVVTRGPQGTVQKLYQNGGTDGTVDALISLFKNENDNNEICSLDPPTEIGPRGHFVITTSPGGKYSEFYHNGELIGVDTRTGSDQMLSDIDRILVSGEMAHQHSAYFDRVLTPQEVRTLYEIGRSGGRAAPKVSREPSLVDRVAKELFHITGREPSMATDLRQMKPGGQTISEYGEWLLDEGQGVIRKSGPLMDSDTTSVVADHPSKFWIADVVGSEDIDSTANTPTGFSVLFTGRSTEDKDDWIDLMGAQGASNLGWRMVIDASQQARFRATDGSTGAQSRTNPGPWYDGVPFLVSGRFRRRAKESRVVATDGVDVYRDSISNGSLDAQNVSSSQEMRIGGGGGNGYSGTAQLSIFHPVPVDPAVHSYLDTIIRDRSQKYHPDKLPVSGDGRQGLSRDVDLELTPYWDDLDYFWTSKWHHHQADGDPVEAMPNFRGGVAADGFQIAQSSRGTLSGGSLGEPADGVVFGGDDYYQIYDDDNLDYGKGSMLTTITPTAAQDGVRTISLWFFGDPSSRAQIRIYNDSIATNQIDIVDSNGNRRTASAGGAIPVGETATLAVSWDEDIDTMRIAVTSDTLGTTSSENIETFGLNSFQNGSIGATANGGSAFTGEIHDVRCYPQRLMSISELEALAQKVQGYHT